RDLDYLLFKRRRFRSAKACYPCRRRKVKCDLSQPCDSCNVRGHADLCEYPQSRIGPEPAEDRTKHGHQGHPFHASQAETANTNSVRGLYVDAVEPYESKVHLGSSSLPKLLTKYQNLNQSKRHDGPQAASFVPGAHPQAIFEILCLQDSSPNFPFTNLWKPDDGPEKIYLALPDDDDIYSLVLTASDSLVRFCQGSLFRILPSVVNFPEFEATLAHFLETRANSTGNASAMFSPNTSPAWFGLLFAILACGGQLAYEADTEILKARVFGMHQSCRLDANFYNKGGS
ncbi:hypothetical protein N7510_000008, partial [Penicillium lagena]|uniref:uncharacterized protein n=1 Tax=Penicillium lagena TaxID=94218 RepID=UPI0025419859